MQLNKFLAHAGACSRRNAVILIKEGKVKVNGITICNPAHRVSEQDVVTVNNKKIRTEHKIYILLNKPKGYVTTVSDEKGRQTVLDLLDTSVKQRVYPVGRLDRDTTGVLLITNDGELTQQLAHPSYEIQKTYTVQLNKSLEVADLQAIRKGVKLEDGMLHVDAITSIPQRNHTVVRITLHSGKHRIIRRLFEHFGYDVVELDRVQFAHLTKRDLPRGTWRHLRIGEVKALKNK